MRRLAREAARLGPGASLMKRLRTIANRYRFWELSRLPRRSCCGVLQKFYGLPGLRVGYVVAPPAVTKAAKRPSASVVGEHVGAACCRGGIAGRRHRRRSLQFMDRERIRLQRGLERLSGVQVFPTKANFILMELPVGYKAARVVSALRRHGLLLRDCSQVPGLNDRSLRVAVRTRDENDRLLKAFGFHRASDEMSRPDSTRFSTQSRVARETLIVDLGARMRVLSSVPRGGLRTTRYILNHQVPSNPTSNSAVERGMILPRYLRRLAESLRD